MFLENEQVGNEKGLEYVQIINDESNRISSMTSQLLPPAPLSKELLINHIGF